MQAQFDSLIRRHQRDVSRLVNRYQSGAIDAEGFGDGLDAVIWNGHSRAIALGRKLAGDKSPLNDDDQLLALDIKDGESEFLNRFVDDLATGRYTLDDGTLNLAQIERRANQYSVKYRASCCQAAVDASAPDEQWNWRLGPTEHCDSCRLLASASPLTRNELWTMPGSCDTECVLGCSCFLERVSDGLILPK